MIKQNGNETIYYAETDNLGSIIGLLNSNGTYAERFSYDPWGRRRNPTNWSYNNVPAPTLVDRGFTGHQHLDVFGLINMNGRMYDPVLGRFLSVDPVIQAPDYSKSFNGYSYCFNNPLSFTDPSGFNAKTVGDQLKIMQDLGLVYWSSSGRSSANDQDASDNARLNAIMYGWDIIINNIEDELSLGGNCGFYKYGFISVPGYCNSWLVPLELILRTDLLADYIRDNFIILTTGGGRPNVYYDAEAMFSDMGFSFVGSGRSLGGFFILAGNQKGSFYPYKEWAAGGATTAGFGYEFGRVDYNGDPLKFSSGFLYGIRDKFWLGGGEFLSGSIARATSDVYGGLKVTAWSFQISISAGFLLESGYNRGIIEIRNPIFKPIFNFK